ncbi:sigma-70 family RNA polymerase sigma factor [Paenibacillus terrigena]|uniref:sigma-70 family RNA polymerase sigma factor n=1 Tax=Paenibacillus terrigena TaxID=369333 RepID=UPI000381E4A7|nr:sigma-70 family RNA polymerase sigma factor [Paenibacillus terrigena]
MNEQDLRPWLIRMSQGDEEALQVVFEATRAHTYRMVYFLAANKQDTDDMVSEVYLELIRCMSNYNREQPFMPWFNGLIVRQVRNWKRRIRRSLRLMERVKISDQLAVSPYKADPLDVVHDGLELLPVVNHLSHKLREVIVLRYYQDYTLEAIAQLLNIPLGTVKSRHRLALAKLRKHVSHTIEERGESTYVH